MPFTNNIKLKDLLQPAQIDPRPRPETQLTLADMLVKKAKDLAAPVTGRIQHWWNDPETQANMQLLSAVAPLQTVWHGSPHKFTKFDMSKIGTGEGAQAYGHGLYFADQPKVAQTYKFIDARVDPDAVEYGGRKLNQLYEASLRKQDRAHRLRDAKAISKANAEAGFWESMMTRNHPSQLMDEILDPDYGWPEQADFVRNLDFKKFKGVDMDPGNLYKVDLPDDSIAKMLDWDKPLSQQPESVMKSLSHALPDYAKDKDAMLANPKEAIEAFLNTDYAKSFPDVRDVKWAKKILNDPEYDIFEDGRSWLESQMRAEEGSSFYNLLGSDKAGSLYSRLGEQTKASAYLKDKGIPGIKYLDQGSRGAGKGTYNYVVFDDTLPKILEINGKPVEGDLAKSLLKKRK